jgi:tetratricopeptide (TPR) repeat protein
MRPHIEVARISRQTGANYKALKLYEQAVDKYSERPTDYRTLIMMNVGSIYLAEGKPEKAIRIWSDTIQRVKDYWGLHSNLVQAYARLKQWDNALEQLNYLLDKYPGEGRYHHLKGSYLIKTGRLEAGIAHLRKALRSGYRPPKTLATIGVAHYLREDYGKAEFFLKWSAADRRKNPETLLWLLAVNLKLDDGPDCVKYAQQLMDTLPISGLNAWLERISETDHYLFPDRNRIIACLRMGGSRKFVQSNKIANFSR